MTENLTWVLGVREQMGMVRESCKRILKMMDVCDLDFD